MHGSDIIFEFNKQDVFIAVSTNKEQIKQLMLNELIDWLYLLSTFGYFVWLNEIIFLCHDALSYGTVRPSVGSFACLSQASTVHMKTNVHDDAGSPCSG